MKEKKNIQSSESKILFILIQPFQISPDGSIFWENLSRVEMGWPTRVPSQGFRFDGLIS